MSKRKRVSSTEKKQKNGHGQGMGVDYKPWLVIQDVSSLGRSTRLKGIKIPRQYEFLSDLERNYFYLLEYSDLVVDIREQYPLLPIEETIVITDELGIKHPVHPQTKEPIVMTTDFLVTKLDNGKSVNLARTLKYKDDLMDERVIEKFEIEREYWQRQGVDWGIVTELEVPKEMALNITFVHAYADLSHIEDFQHFAKEDLDMFSVYLLTHLLSYELTVREAAIQLEQVFNLPSGSGLTLFKHLVITKAIEIDLMHKLDVNQIIEIKSIRKDYSQKVRAI
ncbi:heteromeric transposase endonuclease subunit TnsA [Cytobacillus horneckiae]|uniref:Heteromeric transposase endonuclease subunit TnsA n=1 Tax=Cytobacillus horneckiae TaxID=549687 RepID=A0A2N0ZJW3_9BACI|nr:heteromeric transposase endonuclease subunit TnsA [Cytobacillus horneckiae]MEC1158163.1 heteromeric transposase endonuclease subunit TnsA [Cytobacillus horneckiae]MED2940436.1 heteromeric transposase endonuclease subunit TnsA [Cytobacillus horneckiae]PKG29802.1 heteromeric transposase endonuclease subunit TnsA [Cytobacillus horneckiae]